MVVRDAQTDVKQFLDLWDHRRATIVSCNMTIPLNQDVWCTDAATLHRNKTSEAMTYRYFQPLFLLFEDDTTKVALLCFSRLFTL